MKVFGIWRYRVSRWLGRVVTRTAAVLTLGRMPPFVSTSAIVIRDGSVLVVIDPIRGEPVLPGGHLQWRESPRGAVVREVREETGIDITAPQLFAVYSGEEWAGEPGIVRVIYSAVEAGGRLRSSAEGEATWSSAADLARGCTRDAPIMREWLRSHASPAD